MSICGPRRYWTTVCSRGWTALHMVRTTALSVLRNGIVYYIHTRVTYSQQNSSAERHGPVWYCLTVCVMHWTPLYRVFGTFRVELSMEITPIVKSSNFELSSADNFTSLCLFSPSQLFIWYRRRKNVSFPSYLYTDILDLAVPALSALYLSVD